MTQTTQENNVKQGWDAALADAKRKYVEGRAFVSRMREAIKIIERKIADGEEFPGKNPTKNPELS